MKFFTLLLIICPFAIALVEDGMISQVTENEVAELASEEDRDLVRTLLQENEGANPPSRRQSNVLISS